MYSHVNKTYSIDITLYLRAVQLIVINPFKFWFPVITNQQKSRIETVILPHSALILSYFFVFKLLRGNSENSQEKI